MGCELTGRGSKKYIYRHAKSIALLNDAEKQNSKKETFKRCAGIYYI